MSQQAIDLAGRYLPNAEKAEHMVDSVRVEIPGHMTEPRLPPSVVLMDHRVPIISREAPILSVAGKVIRRRACLAVEVKQPAVDPRRHTVATDAYRDVALQQDAETAGFVMGRSHLLMQFELRVKVKVKFMAERRIAYTAFVDFHGVILAPFPPFPEIGGSLFITQAAESGIRFQPADVVAEVGLTGRLAHFVVASPFEADTYERKFHRHDGLVVHGAELFESPSLTGYGGVFIGEVTTRQCFKVHVNRVEGEH